MSNVPTPPIGSDARERCRLTIVEAISAVLREAGVPMSPPDIYQAILDRRLYSFKADVPLSVVRGQLRRHCAGVDFPSAEPIKFFRMTDSGRFELLDAPLTVSPGTPHRRRPTQAVTQQRTVPRDGLGKLRVLHAQYAEGVKHRILAELRKLDPTAFEQFGRKLLEAYGFEAVEVTQKSRDGGVDGHGRLRVGLGYMRAALQCKRWRGTVGRPEIDRFRGAIQGKYEQGIFFTTATFSKEAEACSFSPGAVPIVLFDGLAIVDIMVEKRLGIDTEYLPIHSYALDNILD